MSHLESKSELDFSVSGSEYELDSSSAFMNLDVCIFFTLYLHCSK